MTPDDCLETYRRHMEEVGEEITIRRYTGTGQNRPQTNVIVLARVMEYDPQELIGTINQGDRKLIVLIDDLISSGFSLPVMKNDKTIVRGRELNIEKVDDNTRRINGVLIAYEIQARGL